MEQNGAALIAKYKKFTADIDKEQIHTHFPCFKDGKSIYAGHCLAKMAKRLNFLYIEWFYLRRISRGIHFHDEYKM